MANLTSNDTQKRHIYHLIPLLFILVVLPLLSKLYVYDPKLSEFDWFPDTDTAADIFLYYKSVFFTITAVIMALLILGKRFIEDRHAISALEFYPLVLYAALAFLSTLFSSYRSFGFSGIYEQFESVWVLLGYCVTAYYAYIFVEKEDIPFLIRSFLVGIFLITLLGMTQGLGHDFFRSDFGQKLLTSGTPYRSLDFTFEEDRVYMSLYNPNYVGSYVALVVPLLICCVIFYKSSEKKILRIAEVVICVLLTGGLLFCLIKSGSKSGLVAVAVSLVLLFFVLLPHIKKYWYLGIVFLVVLAGGIFTADSVMNHQLSNSLKALFNSEKTVYDLEDITVTDAYVSFTYHGEEVHFILTENYKLQATDADGETLSLVTGTDSYTYVIDDERYHGISVSYFPIDGYLSMGVNIGEMTWFFSNDNETGEYLYYNSSGKWTSFYEAPSALFTGHESIATGRGYIWSRTIPLLKKTILLGTGADTFSIYFPNNDYLGMYNSGYYGQTVTKPHNLYLQIGVQTGLFSLLAFLAFYAIYFVSSVKVYTKCSFDEYQAKIGLGIFVGTFAYMITGIINDSTITVAPVFWTLIGVGISINHQIAKTKYKEV